MNFADAVMSAFERYFDFSGRSSRSEYWWFVLFVWLLNTITAIIGVGILGLLAFIATLIPYVAVGVRRFHDLDRTGWWMLVQLIPVIGLLIVWFFAIQRGSPGLNRFGPDPLEGKHSGVQV